MVIAKLATSASFAFALENQHRISDECSIITKTKQFNQVFLFSISNNTKKQLRMCLLNRIINDTIRIGEKSISVDTLGLYVNQPKYFEDEIIAGKSKAKIMYEVTFLSNDYIEHSIGNIKI
jgi:hypothetical protein